MSGTIAATPAPRRFLIIGLPRSGTTYLMTLLNAHRDIHCSGEQFNPHTIVGIGAHDDDPNALIERDRAPLYYMEDFFDRAATEGHARTGFKYMLGHNVRILSKLVDYPDIDLIYVWRENRLAQISSLIKAMESQRWAQTRPDEDISRKITAPPRQIAQRWHEFATMDYLFAQHLRSLPHRTLTLEYRELFAAGINAQLCGFLGVGDDPGMASNLVKQNPNTVLDRFENADRIAAYFRRLGYERWLEPEL